MEAWIILISLIAFIQMGYDKMQAMRGKWRVKEKSLWLSAIIGGALGSLLGMIIFRHKIRKMKFVVGFIVLAIIDVIILLELVNYLPQISIR
ncbi:MAG: DUF1294 domain-containing protein [Kurthia sp.]|nr:DUF1294 domain-containing protein [Candidatus Kurthia equi]